MPSPPETFRGMPFGPSHRIQPSNRFRDKVRSRSVRTLDSPCGREHRLPPKPLCNLASNTASPSASGLSAHPPTTRSGRADTVGRTDGHHTYEKFLAVRSQWHESTARGGAAPWPAGHRVGRGARHSAGSLARLPAEDVRPCGDRSRVRHRRVRPRRIRSRRVRPVSMLRARDGLRRPSHPSDVTQNAVQVNITTAGYTNFSGGTIIGSLHAVDAGECLDVPNSGRTAVGPISNGFSTDLNASGPFPARPRPRAAGPANTAIPPRTHRLPCATTGG
jgi:hypothetical protein